MKFIYSAALVLLMVQAGFSQKIEKNTKLMGGTLEIRGIFPEEGNDTFAIDFNPIVGVFLADNFAVGPGLNLAYSNTNSTNTRMFKFGVSPLIRYYVGEGRLKPFAQGTLGYNWVDMDMGDTSNNDQFYNAGVGVGVAMFPVKAVGVDMSLNYLKNPRFLDGVDAVMFRVAIFAYKRPKPQS